MKKIITLVSIFLMLSCDGQNNRSGIKIVSSNVKEINIINKVDCSMHNLKSTTLKIIDKTEIDEIIDAFSYSESITTGVNMKANNGFFEISFNDGKKDYYFTLNYTVYNGVILRNDKNGERYNNDKLEGVIYPLFVQ